MTSRFERLGMSGKILVVMILTSFVTVVTPGTASAQTVNKTPSLEIKSIQLTIPNILNFGQGNSQDNTPTPQEIQEAKDEQNATILSNYLSQKGSPLAPYASTILQHENWKLVLAISNGESTMCKRQLYNNCWGVGGAWNLKRYESFIDGFTDVNRLITDKYVASGADTPKEIVHKYVGNYSPSWVAAVSQTLAQLDQLPLIN